MRAHREDRPPIATACNKRRKERDGQNLRASGAFTGFFDRDENQTCKKKEERNEIEDPTRRKKENKDERKKGE